MILQPSEVRIVRYSSRMVWARTLVLCLLLTGCEDAEKGSDGVAWDGQTRFEALSAERSGVDFANTLDFDEAFNIYTYRNFYNGGGVALGDVNNDGLTDIYFSGNRVSNRLYLNRGDMQFEDVTEQAGVGGQAAWSTGVTMADVNADGYLDIYLCNSGDIDGDNRRNELYINQQDGSFTEAAADYGLANEGLSTHGVFFDYDRDGDLDFYLLNNSYQAIGSFNLEKNERPKRDSVGGDRLYENRDGYFHDVSERAGIYGSVIGFGLGVTVGDVDRDGWPDLFISNDFFERDYLYMNNRDGTFRETLTESMSSISAASMGADMADLTNDGYPEIFVTEMLPSSNQRMKEATTFENWNRYQYNLKNDYFHQFTRNVLQRNEGDGTFTEVGRLAGVEATDWSWGALIFDMDNDGYKDLYVANGIYQDLTNRDFLDYIADSEFKAKVVESGSVDFEVLVDAIPSNPVRNFAFQNQGADGGFRFENRAEEWGLDLLGFTNGSAYGDLDNDGDLDLVINNTNATALVYRNHTDTVGNYLQLSLQQPGKNPFAVGARVTVLADGQQFYQEHMPMRGFQSSMPYRLHFGLGGIDSIDGVVVEWPDGSEEILQPTLNQHLTVRRGEGEAGEQLANSKTRSAEQILAAAVGIDFVHRENRYSDFDREPLTYHMLSAEGPAVCSADFNGDGRTDVFLGGARGQAGAIYLATPDGNYRPAAEELLEESATSEDVGCACFDADGDGDPDLYVVSGSSEFGQVSTALFDRLYFNEGGSWKRGEQILPSRNKPAAGSTVAPFDYDGDGDVDLFVGSRLRPGQYGLPPSSYLLTNDGSGTFSERAVDDMGMVTAAEWIDLGADGQTELVVVGEFMPPRAYRITTDDVQEVALPASVSTRVGWYTALEKADLDGDGRDDLVLGNHGLNSRFRASPERPTVMYVNDFDGNGRAEQIYAHYENDSLYPTALLHDLVKQMPGLRKRYLKYADFGNQTVRDIFGQEALDRSLYYAATDFRSFVFLNRDSLTVAYLPTAAQESPIRTILATDADGDGDQDLLIGANFNYAKPEVGRYDASRGLLLVNDGGGQFSPADEWQPGVSGEVRGIVPLGPSRYLFARNNAAPVIVRPE